MHWSTVPLEVRMPSAYSVPPKPRPIHFLPQKYGFSFTFSIIGQGSASPSMPIKIQEIITRYNSLSINQLRWYFSHPPALFLDGNVTRNTYQHFQNAERVLQNVIGPEYNASGLIDQCNHGHRNGIMVERNATDQTDLNEVMRQLSYLAKIDQKENVQGKTFFYSRFTSL